MQGQTNRNISFIFCQFTIDDSHTAMKVGTDGVALGAWVSCDNLHRVLDAGCGCGIISLMIAQRCGALIDAVDIDGGACLDAMANVDCSPWRENVIVIHGDFVSFLPDYKYDLIVSNPPFFSSGMLSPDGGRALARHEGGLNYATLIDYAAVHLAPNGRLAFIYPYGYDDEIIYKAEMAHLKLRRTATLQQRASLPPVRVLYEFSFVDGPIESEQLIIRDTEGKYTPRFRQLTKDFYLNSR